MTRSCRRALLNQRNVPDMKTLNCNPINNNTTINSAVHYCSNGSKNRFDLVSTTNKHLDMQMMLMDWRRITVHHFNHLIMKSTWLKCVNIGTAC